MILALPIPEDAVVMAVVAADAGGDAWVHADTPGMTVYAFTAIAWALANNEDAPEHARRVARAAYAGLTDQPTEPGSAA